MFGFKKTKSIWWTSELAKPDLEKSIRLYKEMGGEQPCGTIRKFLLQFEALNYLLMAYSKSNFHNESEQFMCICSLLERELKDKKAVYY